MSASPLEADIPLAELEKQSSFFKHEEQWQSAMADSGNIAR
jgi:hypothetical protein